MKNTEIGMIPDDWEVKRLEPDLGIVKSGKRLPKGYFVQDIVSEHPYIRVIDMEMGHLNTSDIKYVPSEIAHYISKYRIFSEDLYISVAGTLGLVGKIPLFLNGANLTENANKITNIKCNQDFLLYWLMSDKQQEIISASQTLGAQPKLALYQIRNFKIPLPPTLAEQQKIAKALSDVDNVITTLEKLITKKKNLKQGTMQQLLTGKKRLPGFTPAVVEPVETPATKQTELGEIPTDWEVKEIGKILKIGHGRDYKNLKDGNVPVYGTGGYMISVNQYLYDGDTVCIGRKGTIDKPFYHEGKIWTVDTLFYTYDFKSVLPKFLYYKFCLIDWLSMNEASGVPSLTSKNIEDVVIALPSMPEQTAIATILSSMDKEIESLNTKLEKYRNLKTGMMQQLLTGKIRLGGD